MTLRAMEVFLAVVDTGSMRAAAETLYISQPSVSGVIADLEKEYGVRLFERLGKKLYITPEGETLAGYARRMLSLREEADRRMGSLADDTPLRIGATVTVGACVIGDLLRRLPGPPARVLCNNTRVIEQQLLTNRLDAALVEGRVRSRDLLATPVIRDCLLLICRQDSAFAGREGVPLAEIAAAPLLLRERGARRSPGNATTRRPSSTPCARALAWRCCRPACCAARARALPPCPSPTATLRTGSPWRCTGISSSASACAPFWTSAPSGSRKTHSQRTMGTIKQFVFYICCILRYHGERRMHEKES